MRTNAACAAISLEFFGDSEDNSPVARGQAFREAWAFLYNHPLFRIGKVSSFKYCHFSDTVPAYVVADDPREEAIGHFITVECGPPMEVGIFSWKTGCYERAYVSTIDERLTTLARTYEEAIVELAANVLLCYGE